MAKGKNHQPGGAAAVVEALVRPTVEGFGLRLWDVRFEKEGPVWTRLTPLTRATTLKSAAPAWAAA